MENIIESAFLLIAILGILILAFLLLIGLFGHVDDQYGDGGTDSDHFADTDAFDTADSDVGDYDHGHAHSPIMSMKFLVVSPRYIGLFCATFGGVGYYLVKAGHFLQDNFFLELIVILAIAGAAGVGAVYLYHREQKFMDGIETGGLETYNLTGHEARVIKHIFPDRNGAVAVHIHEAQVPVEYFARCCDGNAIPAGVNVIVVEHGLILQVRRSIKYQEGEALEAIEGDSTGLIRVAGQTMLARLNSGYSVAKGDEILVVEDGLPPKIKPR